MGSSSASALSSVNWADSALDSPTPCRSSGEGDAPYLLCRQCSGQLHPTQGRQRCSRSLLLRNALVSTSALHGILRMAGRERTPSGGGGAGTNHVYTSRIVPRTPNDGSAAASPSYGVAQVAVLYEDEALLAIDKPA